MPTVWFRRPLSAVRWRSGGSVNDLQILQVGESVERSVVEPSQLVVVEQSVQHHSHGCYKCQTTERLVYNMR